MARSETREGEKGVGLKDEVLQLALIALPICFVAVCRWLVGLRPKADDLETFRAQKLCLGDLLEALPDLGSKVFYQTYGRDVLSTAFLPMRLDFRKLCRSRRKWLAYGWLGAFYMLFAALWIKSSVFASPQDIKAVAGLEIIAARVVCRKR